MIQTHSHVDTPPPPDILDEWEVTGVRVPPKAEKPNDNGIIMLVQDELHSGQWEIIDHSKQFNVVACGRRFGKTIVSSDIAMNDAIDGKLVGYFAPNYKILDPIWREIKGRLQYFIREIDNQKKRIELLSGGVIEFWSLANDKDAGRSRKYHTAIFDEAALIRHLEEIWVAISPTLLDYDGRAWLFSSPKGDNYFKTLWDKGDEDSDTHDPEWKSWQMPTSSNPHITQKALERFKNQMTAQAYSQEYLAQFVKQEGFLFRGDTVNYYDTFPSGHFQEAAGLDFGYTASTTGDYSVMLVGRWYGQDLYLTNMIRLQTEVTHFMGWVKNARVRRMGAYIGGQEGGVLDLAKQLHGLNITRFAATSNKYTRALPVAGAWENGRIFLPRDAAWVTDFLRELLAFTGLRDVHDDIIDALASLWAMKPVFRPRRYSTVR